MLVRTRRRALRRQALHIKKSPPSATNRADGSPSACYQLLNHCTVAVLLHDVMSGTSYDATVFAHARKGLSSVGPVLFLRRIHGYDTMVCRRDNIISTR